MREARRRGQDPGVIANAAIPIAVAALIGARLYHVIDQWAVYRDNLPAIVLPPYSGLGVYGALIGGLIALVLYCRWKGYTVLLWVDILAPAILLGQAIARWGNFFNQELYGGPTNLPWGIAIQCSHRIVQYACPAGSDPNATLGQHFQPLFLYESLSGLLGLLALLFLARRFARRLRTGDILAAFFIWYGVVRFGLETLRADNWTFFGVPMAQIFSTIFILLGIAIIAIRHLSGAPTLLVVDSAAKVAALEPVGVPGEGGVDDEADLAAAMDASEAADAALEADAGAAADGGDTGSATDEAPDPEDDLTELLAPAPEDAPASEPAATTPPAATAEPTASAAPAVEPAPIVAPGAAEPAPPPPPATDLKPPET
jgi:phosphatidylglycerol:prolipoprotein diacylglycerol transferase